MKKLTALVLVLFVMAFAAPAYAGNVESTLDNLGQYASNSGERFMGGIFNLAEGVLKLPVSLADTQYEGWAGEVEPALNQSGENLVQGGWEVLTFAVPQQQQS